MCNVCENQIVCYRVNYWFKKRSFFKYLLTCLSKISEILVELRLDYIYFVMFISLFVDRYNLCYTLGNLFELILQLNTYIRIGAIIIADNLRCLEFLTGFQQTLLSPYIKLFNVQKVSFQFVFVGITWCICNRFINSYCLVNITEVGVKQISSNNRIR